MENCCVLCKSVSRTGRYTSAAKWNKETLKWIEGASDVVLSPKSLICRRCEQYVHQHTCKGETPCSRWANKHNLAGYLHKFVISLGHMWKQ
jgi:Fe2+ or Zn2+ uptake regulation protein